MFSISTDWTTFEEVWSSSLANCTNLRIFCSLTCAHVDESVLEQRARKNIFLRYVGDVKGYWLWCPNLKSLKHLITKDVIFDEYALLCPS